MTEDPVEEIARVAARQLTSEFGARLEAEVEAALYTREANERHEYDPVAIGALIVSIAQLAWMIYSDHRKKAPDTSPEVFERMLRTEIKREVEVTPTSLRITEVVVEEILGDDHRG